MRLTLHTDYALRSLIYLAAHPDERVPIKEIADVYEISENHLIKVIHRLGQGKFIETTRGRGGGLSLNKPASEVVVGQVVRYMEGDMTLVDCDGLSSGGKCCLLSSSCKLRQVFREATDAFLQILDKYSIADLINHSGVLDKILNGLL